MKLLILVILFSGTPIRGIDAVNISDDIDLPGFCCPKLTTCRQDLEEARANQRSHFTSPPNPPSSLSSPTPASFTYPTSTEPNATPFPARPSDHSPSTIENIPDFPLYPALFTPPPTRPTSTPLRPGSAGHLNTPATQSGTTHNLSAHTTQSWRDWVTSFNTVAKAFLAHPLTQMLSTLLAVGFTFLVLTTLLLLRRVYLLTARLMMTEDVAHFFCLCNDTTTTPCRPACKFFYPALYRSGFTTNQLEKHQRDFLIKIGYIRPALRAHREPFRPPTAASILSRLFAPHDSRRLPIDEAVEMSPILQHESLADQLQALQDTNARLLRELQHIQDTRIQNPALPLTTTSTEPIPTPPTTDISLDDPPSGTSL